MRVGFDVSQTIKTKAGCGYFAEGLIRELAACDQDNEYILYPAVGDFFWNSECATTTFACDQTNFRRLKAPKDFETSRQFWRNPGKDFERDLGGPDIVHTNNFFCPIGLNQARLVYTLHDLSFLQEPSWSAEHIRAGCFQGVFQASLFADFIIATSQYTRQHFLSTFPHFSSDRVEVIYPGSRFSAASLATPPKRCRNLKPVQFWLTVGTIEPRKNYRRLVEAYRLLKSRDASTFPLVLVGGHGWLMEDFDPAREGLEVGKDIFLTGYVSDAELCWFYRNCFAFIYPSLFEGFGMPVLEALSLGTPVLCSNTSSLPEAAGEAALFFDPYDVNDIVDAMLRFTKGTVDSTFLKAAAQKQAGQFSWRRSGSRVRELYRHVAKLPRAYSNSSQVAPGSDNDGSRSRHSRLPGE